MQFVEEFDSVYIPDEEQDEWVFKPIWFTCTGPEGKETEFLHCFVFVLHRDSDERAEKAELLHSNSCLRMLYTDLQKNVEMAEDSNVLLRTENSELKNQIKR